MPSPDVVELRVRDSMSSLTATYFYQFLIINLTITSIGSTGLEEEGPNTVKVIEKKKPLDNGIFEVVDHRLDLPPHLWHHLSRHLNSALQYLILNPIT